MKLSKRQVAVLSAFTEKGNRHEELLADLDKLGYPYQVQPGNWKGQKELSVTIFDIPFKEAKRLAQKYQQEAFVHEYRETAQGQENLHRHK